VLYRHVPAAVPGVCFLSGGQSDEAATAHLDAMVRRGPHPWEISFSYSRALQNQALQTWLGRNENREAAQRAYYHRAKLNGAARRGSYSAALEADAA
jgi:fructose-bisphosphate aldolase class I